MSVRLFEWDSSNRPTPNPGEEMWYSPDIARAFIAYGSSTLSTGAVDVVADILNSRSTLSDTAHNNLGEQRKAWTIGDLMRQTSNRARAFIGELVFSNPDSEGSHSLEYEVLRVSE